MTIHTINETETDSVKVTVRESDKYTQAAFVRFDRHHKPEDVRGCNELFISTEELRQLGYFLVEQAKMIEAEQRTRIE